VNDIRSRVTRITLRARHVLPMATDPIENGWVRIDQGRIAGVGSRPPTGPVIDLGDALILPGLVNAHTHLEFSDLDTPVPVDGGLPAWIERVVAIRRSRGPTLAETPRLATAVASGLRESAAAGVTAVGDIVTAVPPQAVGPGPRVRAFREALGLSAAAMADAAAAVSRDLGPMSAAGGSAGISPHAPYTVGLPLGRMLIGEACRRRLPVAMHLAESRDEVELLATGAGRFRQLLERLGAWLPEAPPRLLPPAAWISLLSQVPRGIVVHGTYLPDDPLALARLARHRDRLCVAVCPRTTLALSGGPPPVAAFRAAGVRVAIGTDSRASNPDLSILAECRALVDLGLVSPAEALSMATLHGSWALALEHRCGSIACGRPADLAVLRPAGRCRDPFAAAIDPATEVIATLRGGRVIAGRLA
jgi:cytosine/adenosine deaminase-related metal-dependent hydrolase